MRRRTPKNPAKFLLVFIPSLLVVLAIVVGLILGITYYSLNQSDAAEAGRKFLRSNELLRNDIGVVKDFGRFISGHLRSGSSVGEASLKFKVYGERKTVTATVTMVSKENRGWRVVAADYINDQGRRVTLFDPYEQPEPEELPSPAP